MFNRDPGILVYDDPFLDWVVSTHPLFYHLNNQGCLFSWLNSIKQTSNKNMGLLSDGPGSQLKRFSPKKCLEPEGSPLEYEKKVQDKKYGHPNIPKLCI